MISFLRSFISKKRKQREMGRKGLIGSRKLRKADETLSSAVDKSKMLGVFILAIVWFVSIWMLVLPTPKLINTSLVVNQLAPKSIFSDFNFTFEDEDKTRKKMEKTRAEVPLYYKIDSASVRNSLIDLDAFLEEVKKKVNSSKTGTSYKGDENSKVVRLASELDKITLNGIYHIASDPEQVANFRNYLRSALEKGVLDRKEKKKHTYGQMVRLIDTRGRISYPRPLVDIPTPFEAAEKISGELLKYYSHKNKDIVRQNLNQVVASLIGESGDLAFDRKYTEKIRDAAAAKVLPMTVNIKKRQPIIVKDQKVTAKDLALLKVYSEEQGERTASINFWRKLIKSTLICLFLMIVTGLYISHIHPEVTKSNQSMWLIGSVVIFSLILNYIFIILFNKLSPELNIPPIMISQVIILAFPAVLLSVLLGLRVAVYAGLFVSLIAAMMVEDSLSLLIKGMLVSGFAGFAVRHSMNYRSYFMRVFVTVTVSFIILDIISLWELKSMSLILWTLGLSLLNGILTGIFSLVSLFVFEALFQISTNMTLLTLCDYNHPLLKRLQFEAPGTYHHSLMVSSLAEHAAIEIDANPIKARVCALFHDIGKLIKPEYFIENNIGGENKHRELRPRMSSLIILNHVKEGVDMAIKYKLRKIIRDAIQQHHGTDLVYFFYKRAIEENRAKNTPVEEQEYRYPGPLPTNKEVVLVSLADACEAASRTLQKASPGKIDALVWEIFRKRLKDGQLDAAELTFGELSKVRKSFVKTLTTMLHARVPYPKEEEITDENDLFVASGKTPAGTEKQNTAQGAAKSP